MISIPKLYCVADLLISQEYFHSNSRSDPIDPRIIKATSDEIGTTNSLLYIARIGLSFGKEGGPYTLYIEKSRPDTSLETLSLHSRSRRGKVEGGYSSEGNEGLLARAERVAKEGTLDTRTMDILDNLLKNVEHTNNFVSYGFEFEGRTASLMDLVVVMMGLKPWKR